MEIGQHAVRLFRGSEQQLQTFPVVAQQDLLSVNSIDATSIGMTHGQWHTLSILMRCWNQVVLMLSNWLAPNWRASNAVAPITRRAIAAYGFGGSASSFLDRQSRHGKCHPTVGCVGSELQPLVEFYYAAGRTWLSGGSCRRLIKSLSNGMQMIPV